MAVSPKAPSSAPRDSSSSDRRQSQQDPRQLAHNAVLFSQQAEKLSHQQPSSSSLLGPSATDKPATPNSTSSSSSSASVAVEARFVTPQDPVIVTSDGNRLPGVPLQEAHKLNILREELEGKNETVDIKDGDHVTERVSGDDHHTHEGNKPDRVVQLPSSHKNGLSLQQEAAGGTLKRSMPPSSTNPLFPPLPLYGPPSVLRDMQCLFFRVSSFFLSLAFLGVIVLGALFTSIPIVCNSIFHRLTFRSLDKKRPLYEEEQRRARERREKEHAWKRRKSTAGADEEVVDDFPPTEGGKDPVICDVGYYARRVGLDVETFKVQTEDGFIIDLHHVYDPKEHTPRDETDRDHQGPDVFCDDASIISSKASRDDQPQQQQKQKPKFPVLLMHGLLQSPGAYCCNDDSSLAFWLCKSGFDVWLGANRCGFDPRHALLDYPDPRMWCWNIRQMGVFDLPALTSRVLGETGFAKLGLVAHSQGTTQTLVALAKEQRPDLGEKLTVFCGLAPAAYAGPLIGKMYFKFMRIISPAMFRLIFGIHAFIPFMMTMHGLLPPHLYGWLGYKVFSFLFSWTDARWDRELKARMFQFSPVYVSAESMRWWLGRECFAKHKCILATKDAVRAEERMDNDNSDSSDTDGAAGSSSWYDKRAPPFAFWVCGSDELVDGRRLLRRFETGREPDVRIVKARVLPEFEHLDVLWAMDAEERVFGELREVLWGTCDVRDVCRVPVGCEGVEAM
jgi:pimeloyl-ACP methyl ester carboxylesterase